jgi:hypothetical protein
VVQGIDNLTRIDGQILTRAPHPSLSDYDLMDVRIDAAAPVEGRADLLSPYLGQTLGFAARRELLGAASPGDVLHCRAKRTPDGAMCEPHPDTGDFRVEARH